MLGLEKKVRRIKAAVPTSSMADIAFLLIIFFMVATVQTTDRTSVTLPASVVRDEMLKNSVIITATADGQLRFTVGEVPTDVYRLDDLLPLIRKEVDADANRTFVIKSDKAVRYDTVDKILSKLRDAQARNVFFLTEQTGPRH